MTTGAWLLLLEYIWTSTEYHEAFNKWGGVAMAIVGAILVAPQASKHLGYSAIGKPSTQLAGAIQRLWNRLRHRDLTQVTTTVSISSESQVGTPSAAQTLPWDEDAAIEQKVQWLKDHVKHLDDVWQARAKRLEEIDQLTKQELDQLTARVYNELERLGNKIGKIERDSVMIDATGLLPILFGIILTGVPEELASFGPWGWVVWFAGAAVTVGAVIRSLLSNIWC